ncbi:hypothetical protein PIROE2DRAFT_12563 [Piromyces sp. E2]|nr:hypothetical protein PIROE2DRAFT_12563 [Piromyces sp. E2]|eukprot:OUM61412.1 hypothetical protein PIROE2DRAFT_12563 [Piromyces sp. E2]
MQYEDFERKLISQILKDKKNFKLVEKVLSHSLFTEVLRKFKESDVLIRACKKEKKDAVKWLMTMNINPLVQDTNGMTALMYAVKQPSLLFAVKEILRRSREVLSITDNNGETVLFHAISNIDAFRIIIETGKFDINHCNKNNDTVLIKCCQNKNYDVFDLVVKITDNINQVNNDNKTAAMFLVNNCRDEELLRFVGKNLNVNYKSKNNETLVSILMSRFIKLYSFVDPKDDLLLSGNLERCIKTMIVLLYLGCNFNVPFDKEGNTPITYFMMINDYYNTTFLLERYKYLDLSIKNENGINASLLSLYIPSEEKEIKQKIVNNKTFDCSYCDNNNNNLLMYCVARENPVLGYNQIFIDRILKSDRNAIYHVNNKNENIVIISTKLGKLNSLYVNENNVNQQDYLGNTALHYAIKLKDGEAINLLCYYRANPHIKNNEGVSPLELVNEANRDCTFDISEILNHPVTPEEFSRKIEKDGKKYLIVNKKKTTDEKVEDYAKNYQIKNYRTEYDYLIKKKRLLRIYLKRLFTKAPKELMVLRSTSKYSSPIHNQTFDEMTYYSLLQLLTVGNTVDTKLKYYGDPLMALAEAS